MEVKKESKRIRFSRIIYFILAALFAFSIVIQVFLAGLAVFVNPLNRAKHTNFVHLFELIPILMFIFAFIGQLPRWARWQSVGLFGLIFVMYFTAHSTGFFLYAAAAHPVIAMLLFWSSIILTRRSFQLLKLENK